MEILGIDIGGTGIKGAPVDIDQGALTAPRQRIPTPEPSKPAAVAQVIAEIARLFSWSSAVGCGFPGIVRDGVILSAANMHKDWIGIEAQAVLRDATGCQVVVTNDADAAGMAEMKFGAGRDRKGVVLVVTIGTGLGTALFVDGVLVPNTEFGHIEIDCFDAESRASDAARQRDKLSWKKWTRRFDRYLNKLEDLLTPNLIILGGGASKRHERFIPQLTVQTQVLPAELLNDAGIIGAALAASRLVDERNPG
jgi:polyphosphate glucokinase